MKTSALLSRDPAFAVAFGLLVAVSLGAFFCDSHWRRVGDPRVAWTVPASLAGPAAGGLQP